MPNESASLQLNLGALRASMSLTLHTHHASRVWHGRAPAEGRPGIIGLNGFVAVMNKLKRGVEQDDPYSDGWMLRIEDKLEQTKVTLQTLREQVEQALAGVPSALSLGENLNVQPVKLPLFIHSPLGFKAVYLLADFDELARRLILAHHTALIDRNTLERWLNEGAHALRSLFSLAQQYRYSGATREDFRLMNAVARGAVEKFGELPQEILDGSRRSPFAPPLAPRASEPKTAAERGEAPEGAAGEAGPAAGDGATVEDEGADDEGADDEAADGEGAA
ncbi:MAG: TIGR03761 family integrating conjugative element protein [Candidatus Accumulibacter sp.]|jgi:integrating conjugative element protein (TIGR03761 family)|nr:TIGR03761 family integrating conjugative element protein [Accumulibacter sp.]